ncbi:hypothetical protein, partial [Shewanella algicola]|uniref:hypothetical protein n=1 Tax=Shewanella algicola TaxID=640633 RepID=UPI002494CD58
CRNDVEKANALPLRTSSLSACIRDPGVAVDLAWALKAKSQHLDSGLTALPERRSSRRHLNTNEQRRNSGQCLLQLYAVILECFY